MRVEKRRNHINVHKGVFDVVTTDAVSFKAMSFWYSLRNKYANGVFYDYKAHKLSKNTDVSTTAVSNYVKWNIKHGFMAIQDGNLVLINPAKVLGIKTKSLWVDCFPWTTFEQLHMRIFGKMIKLNQDTQKWMGDTGSKINSTNGSIARKDYKKYQKIKSNQNGEAVLMPDKCVHNSSRQLSKLLNINQRTIVNWLHKAERMGYLKVKEVTSIVKGPAKYIPFYAWLITKGVYAGMTCVHHGSLITVMI